MLQIQFDALLGSFRDTRSWDPKFIQEGLYNGHDWAVQTQQWKRMCLLMGQSHDQSDDTAYWLGLAAFANFEPKSGKSRTFPWVIFWPEDQLIP
jgi:hypothetical protein